MTQPAKRYHRVIPGCQSAHAAECLAGDFGIEQNLSGKRPEDKH